MDPFIAKYSSLLESDNAEDKITLNIAWVNKCGPSMSKPERFSTFVSLVFNNTEISHKNGFYCKLVIKVSNDMQGIGVCCCGQQNLKYLYMLGHVDSNRKLLVGSICATKTYPEIIIPGMNTKKCKEILMHITNTCTGCKRASHNCFAHRDVWARPHLYRLCKCGKVTGSQYKTCFKCSNLKKCPKCKKGWVGKRHVHCYSCYQRENSYH